MTPWDRYGPDASRDAHYEDVTRRVREALRRRGIRERNWTGHRIASTALAESRSGSRWSDRRRRTLAGRDRGDFRQRLGDVYDDALALAESLRGPNGGSRRP